MMVVFYGESLLSSVARTRGQLSSIRQLDNIIITRILFVSYDYKALLHMGKRSLT